ncbi:monooxygenase [Amorphus sp. 3PC139-8]|uniref:monooxygenase n=1 Tax=Amorphus sp. 3PC139-8 TaxID=2735676 RepID=UPI00345DC9FB
MATLLVFEFPSEGPFGGAAAEAYRELAEDISQEPNLIWKVWTESSEKGVAGGVYLFETEDAARAYTEKHAARLTNFGITDIQVREYSVNDPLSVITRGR